MTREERIRIMLKKDRAFNGQFFVAVITRHKDVPLLYRWGKEQITGGEQISPASLKR